MWKSVCLEQYPVLLCLEHNRRGLARKCIALRLRLRFMVSVRCTKTSQIKKTIVHPGALAVHLYRWNSTREQTYRFTLSCPQPKKQMDRPTTTTTKKHHHTNIKPTDTHISLMHSRLCAINHHKSFRSLCFVRTYRMTDRSVYWGASCRSSSFDFPLLISRSAAESVAEVHYTHTHTHELERAHSMHP